MKNAFFDETIFHGNTVFSGTTFDSGVQFTRATFSGWTIFDKTHFAGHAGFTAIRVTGAFDLANARFERVPDFVQAHFDEGPRLDHIRVRERMTEPGRAWTFPARLSKGVYRRVFHPRPDVPVRYRALRRLAIQGLDSDRALSFFAGEVRSARLNGDWPLPWPPWRSKGWAGVVRFWIGVAYELLSGFGRSVVLPFMWWCLVSAVFVVYYLGQSPDVRSERTSSPDHGITRYVSVSLSALLYKHPCWAKTPSSTEELTPLTQSVRVQTSAAIEAVHLSLRNALIILDSNNDATLRTYGCLYGVDRNNGNPVAFVPSSVSFASIVQKLVSGVLIFLLGLGIRNLLKMK